MKKILLTSIAAVGLAATASAQLADGSVFPDFTRTDIHGNVHHLYDDLNSGKTVFIDISATWCAPCWAYKQTHAFDSLWSKHGPLGQPGVNATSTNDVVVYFIQGEPTSGIAELTNNGIGSGAVTTGGTYATFTQGDWTANTSHPIIDDSTAQAAYNTAWHIAYFPTVYMICRDHIVHELTQPTEAAAYAASLAGCPNYAPSASLDAKAVATPMASYYACNATPSVSFQNYSTANITSATVKVMDATNAVVATVPWTGSLAPYDVANVAVPSFAGTTFGGYKFSVTVAGDAHPSNDVSVDSLFKIYTAATAVAIPYTENFNGDISYKESFSSDGYTFPASTSSLVDPSGANTPGLVFECFNYSTTGGTTEYVVNNFNTATATNYKLEFDVAYAQYDATRNEVLSVKVSTDCGATWTTPWSQSGSALATAAVTTSEYIPSATSQWKHINVDMSAFQNANTLLKFVATTAYGNDIWVDNINLKSTVGVQDVQLANEISLTPNPAKDMANVMLSLTEATTVQVLVTDMVGHSVYTTSANLAAGSQKIAISTSDLAPGIYNVKIVAGSSITTKQLSVIK